MDNDRLAEQQNNQNQVDLKSSSNSMAGSDDSLDKSDLDDNPESQDNYKSLQNQPVILELGQKIGSDRSAFVRAAQNSRTSPTSSLTIDDIKHKTTINNNHNDLNTSSNSIIEQVDNRQQQQQQPQKKRNPYSIEELLKKDENRVTIKRPRLIVDPSIVQPCGIIVSVKDN